MKTLKFDSKEEWLQARRGKITGSRLKDVLVKRGSGKKIGFYELVAERLGIAADGEDVMERGTRLEPEAMELFIKESKKKVDTSLVMWQRDDDENIAISPDGFVGKTEAVEVKCLSSARHIEAWLTKQVPSEYEEQMIQYFVVNDELKKLFFVFYDPRLIAKPFFTIQVKRKDIQEKIDITLEYEKMVLAEVDEAVNSLTY